MHNTPIVKENSQHAIDLCSLSVLFYSVSVNFIFGICETVTFHRLCWIMIMKFETLSQSCQCLSDCLFHKRMSVRDIISTCKYIFIYLHVLLRTYHLFSYWHVDIWRIGTLDTDSSCSRLRYSGHFLCIRSLSFCAKKYISYFRYN